MDDNNTNDLDNGGFEADDDAWANVEPIFINLNESVGDQLKRILAADMQRRTGTDLPPMIGAFSLVAEYTNEEGKVAYLTVTDLSLPPWQELGLLETRLAILKSRMGIAVNKRYGGDTG